jgi:hypothetical protein
MRDYCETEHCEFPAVEEVPVSISEREVVTRSLCASCAAAYHAGVQNGHLRAVRNLRRLGHRRTAQAVGSLFHELDDDPRVPDASHQSDQSLILYGKCRVREIARRDLGLDPGSFSDRDWSRILDVLTNQFTEHALDSLIVRALCFVFGAEIEAAGRVEPSDYRELHVD